MHNRMFDKFAAFLHRGNVFHGGKPTYGAALTAIVLLIAIFGSLCVATGFYLFDATRSWGKAIPQLQIDRQNWRVYYGSSPTSCLHDGEAAPQCLAAMHNPILWNSPLRRNADDHWDRVAQLAGKEYWLGTTIAPSIFKQAVETNATHLVLGYFNADYEVWINGQKFHTGKFRSTRFPAVLNLTPEMFKQTTQNGSLHIAIRIMHNAGAMFPDTFATNRAEGFLTAEDAQAYLQAETIENQIRPTLFFSSFLVLGLLAVAGWSLFRMRQELLYVGLYAILHATIQLVDSNLSNGWKSIELGREIRIFTLFYEGALALGFGLTWARTRWNVVSGIMLILFATPFGVIDSINSPATLRAWALNLHTWYVPACYFLGAAMCLIQGFYLLNQNIPSKSCIRRYHRLFAVGAILLALGYFYWLEANTAFSITEYAAWYRLSNILVIGLFFGIGMIDIGEIDRIARDAPLSKYHRLPELPQAVTGTLIIVDLKDSEVLIDNGAQHGQSGDLLLMCISRVWSLISSHDGIVIQTDGDAVVAFFDESDKQASLKKALNALTELSDVLQHLEHQFKTFSSVPHSYRLKFRGSLTFGQIRPVWQFVGGHRNPSWSGVGSVNAFLEVARLMELERQIPDARQSSCVVMRSDLATIVDNVVAEPLEWLARGQALPAKNNKMWLISAFKVCGEHSSSKKIQDHVA